MTALQRAIARTWIRSAVRELDLDVDTITTRALRDLGLSSADRAELSEMVDLLVEHELTRREQGWCLPEVTSEHTGGEWCPCGDCDPLGKLDASREARREGRDTGFDAAADVAVVLVLSSGGYATVYGLAVAASWGWL